MKRSANYVTDDSEILKPREYKLKNNTVPWVYAEVTPLYETKLYDNIRIEHYSFENNEKLRGLWQKTSRIGVKRDDKIKKLRQLPDFTRDYHFHNQACTLLPSQSLRNRPPAHFVLTPGPGIDKYGEKPIPDDMIMKIYQRDNKGMRARTT